MADGAALPVRVFSAPLRYVQGPGALDRIGEHLGTRHSRALVLVDEFLVERVAPRLRRALADAGVDVTLTAIGGEVTQSRIDELANRGRPLRATVVVAVGGGKTLDTGKGVARALGTRMVTVPTIASNDGPTSRVIALYDEEHRLVGTPRMEENPEAVIVDTELVSSAPAHFLVSGIGDAVAKRFEAAACSRGTGLTSHGSRPLELPLIIAEGCYAVLVRDGPEALADAGRGDASPALERVVEAVVLMSGLAFENGGLSLAHSMTRGLMILQGARDRLHGYQVAYGLLVQLVHEGDDRSYREVRSYLRSVGLPLSLRDLGATASTAVFDALARAATRAPHLANCVPVPTVASLTAALRTVESFTG